MAPVFSSWFHGTSVKWHIFALCSGPVVAVSLALIRRWRQRRPIIQPPAAVQRTRKYRVVLPHSGKIPALPIDVHIAPPPRVSDDGKEDPLVLYVLDPEPQLFAIAATFAYAQAAYFAKSKGTEEAQFRRLYIIGIGHAAESFDLGPDGFDSVRLRNLRRRDFPPWNHPAILPGGEKNARAARLVDEIADRIVPYVEQEILGFEQPVHPDRRCVLGASYSAVVALQVLLARPSLFGSFILGSPSVCFDPAILDELRQGSWKGTRVFIAVGTLEREHGLPGNVHDNLVLGAENLANTLRQRGATVDPAETGVHELTGEDHSTMKLPLISRGLTWFMRNQVSHAHSV